MKYALCVHSRNEIATLLFLLISNEKLYGIVNGKCYKSRRIICELLDQRWKKFLLFKFILFPWCYLSMNKKAKDHGAWPHSIHEKSDFPSVGFSLSRLGPFWLKTQNKSLVASWESRRFIWNFYEAARNIFSVTLGNKWELQVSDFFDKKKNLPNFLSVHSVKLFFRKMKNVWKAPIKYIQYGFKQSRRQIFLCCSQILR